ncbi:MAG: Na/Pi cotransporter family protein, partial [Bilifractor sp.]|nr:Na/Pi cotransporter family protein [Bilifractor sp.]
MNEKVQIVFGLLGGLAIFLFGMNMMSDSLQKAAG